MTLPIVILGGGGHGRVVLDTLREMNAEVLGVVDPNPDLVLPAGLRLIGASLSALSPADCRLALGVGSVDVDTANRRRQLFAEGKAAGFGFASLRHPGAIISRDVSLGEGVQVMAGTVLQPGVRLGDNVIVNSRASVDHDCRIGDHVHIAPGVVLSGGVEIGAGTHIGTGAVVIQGIAIGAGAMIGAGVVVTRPVAPSARLGLARRNTE